MLRIVLIEDGQPTGTGVGEIFCCFLESLIVCFFDRLLVQQFSLPSEANKTQPSLFILYRVILVGIQLPSNGKSTEL